MPWWLFQLVLAIFWLLTVWIYYSTRGALVNEGAPRTSNYKRLSIAVIIFYVAVAVYLSVVQYNAWNGNEYDRVFLRADYFFPHIAVSFWLDAALSVLVATLFYFLLKGINKYRSGFFQSDEVLMGFLTALIAGWPGVIIFLVAFLLFFLIESLVKGLVFKQKSISINFSMVFLVSAAVTLIFGEYFFQILF